MQLKEVKDLDLQTGEIFFNTNDDLLFETWIQKQGKSLDMRFSKLMLSLAHVVIGSMLWGKDCHWEKGSYDID